MIILLAQSSESTKIALIVPGDSENPLRFRARATVDTDMARNAPRTTSGGIAYRATVVTLSLGLQLCVTAQGGCYQDVAKGLKARLAGEREEWRD